ncbi:MAG: flagellar motor protein MotB [Syntrophales bacterium]|nr:flagellar motor protein MotB [Syntrophales bacterium]
MEPELRKKSKEGPAAVGWESIYCSLVLILVALFAMLVSYSTVEGERMTNFMRGFDTEQQTSGESSVLEPRDTLNFGKPGGGQSRNALSSSQAGTEDDKKIITVAMQALQLYFEKMNSGDLIDIKETEAGFRATLNSSLLFPSGTAAVEEGAYPYIDKMIAVLLEFPFSVRIEGHTDDIPIHTPRFSSNWELSTTRAINVMRSFVERGELSADRLCAVGFGEYHPIASNETPDGRHKNRRVEIFFNLGGEKSSV